MTEPPPDSHAARLRVAREAAGLSRAALAERLGGSYSLVANAENGKPVTLDWLWRAAEAIGCDPHDLDPGSRARNGAGGTATATADDERVTLPDLSCRGCGVELNDYYDFTGVGLGVYVCLDCEPATVWCQACVAGHRHDPGPVVIGELTRPPGSGH